MGDAQGQSGVAAFVIFLDENHCNNPHLLRVLTAVGIPHERHLDHFAAGLPDVEWLPQIARKGWVLLTSDTKIRYNELERQSVRDNNVQMFYFSRNNIGGKQMGEALTRALPQMQRISAEQAPPFTASITRTGEVHIRDIFAV